MVAKAELPLRPCVGVMLINREGRIFVGRRAERKAASEGEGDWWQMPQGGLEEGEDPEGAARRELEEETGVTQAVFLRHADRWYDYDLPSGLVGIAWEGRFRGQTQLWFVARFEGEDADIDLGSRKGHAPEFDAWRWVTAGELLKLVVPFKRHVYEAVLREFAPLISRAEAEARLLRQPEI